MRSRNSYKKWTQEDLEYLRKHYPDGDTEVMAKEMGVTPHALRARAYTEGLRKNKAFRSRLARERRKHMSGEDWYSTWRKERKT